MIQIEKSACAKFKSSKAYAAYGGEKKSETRMTASVLKQILTGQDGKTAQLNQKQINGLAFYLIFIVFHRLTVKRLSVDL